MAWFNCNSKHQSDFTIFSRILFSQNFAYAKFRENEILMKISEFTAAYHILLSRALSLCISSPSTVVKRMHHAVKHVVKERLLCIISPLSKETSLSDALLTFN